MIALTASVTIPNISRVKVTRVYLADDIGEAYVYVTPLAPGGVAYPSPGAPYILTIRNGSCDILNSNAGATGFFDRVIATVAQIPAGYTNVATAWLTGGGSTPTTRLRSVETQGLTDGWLGAGFAGVVS